MKVEDEKELQQELEQKHVEEEKELPSTRDVAVIEPELSIEMKIITMYKHHR